MITIYTPHALELHLIPFNTRHLGLVFDCEPGKIEYTDDITKANLIAMTNTTDTTYMTQQYTHLKSIGYTNQLICVLNLFHIEEGFNETQIYEVLCSLYGKEQVLFVHHNYAQKENYDLVYYDMMYARSKIYFTEYENYDMIDRVWTHHTSKKMYELSEIIKTPRPKHYLAPMRTYDNNNSFLDSPRVKFRKQLREILPKDKGYINDLTNGVVLRSQEHTDKIQEAFASPECSYAGGTWYPVHNDYYNDSLVSIYVESITHGASVTSVTEKTFDPLIKGHFILPYGYKGLVKDITAYGFILPDWIDYSYDDCDDDCRWEKYTLSVLNYIDTPIEEIIAHVQNDMHILHHNRSIFYTRPRMSLIDIIEERKLR